MADVDWGFIADREGPGKTTAYVPTDALGKVLGKSGATAATGFDIGQRSSADIDKLPISEALKTKLKPFASKTGDDAVKALADYKTANKVDFTITVDEAKEIDLVPKKTDFVTLKANYNLAIAGKPGATQFEFLPEGIQTAIASVAFQYGVGLATATPTFWKNVTDQDWDATAKTLDKFGDAYPTRRKLEAGKLRDGMKSLPAAAATPVLTTTTAGGAAATAVPAATAPAATPKMTTTTAGTANVAH